MNRTSHSPTFEHRVRSPAWLALLESLGLAALLLVIGSLVNRSDPFLMRRGFSWMALAPLLAGLRHGSGYGMLCGAALDVLLAVGSKVGLATPTFELEAAFGWVAIGLLVGEFSDAWQRRGRELETAAGDLRLQLVRLSRDQRALEVSHERLQRQVPGESNTLRDALATLGKALDNHPGPDKLPALGSPILWLFAEHAFVQSGSLHPLAPDGRPGPCVATLGAGGGRDVVPLLLAAAESGEVTSVWARGDGSDLLCAVPLVDALGQVHGVVAIRDMPFVSLHNGSLTLLAVIGGYLGDALASARPKALEATPPRSSRQPVGLRTGAPGSTFVAQAAGAGVMGTSTAQDGQT